MTPSLSISSRFRACALLAACLPLLLAAGSANALGIGDKAPIFQAAMLEGGGELDLAAYQGKVIYLDFWASWCPPCLTSLPILEKLRKQYPEESFQIVAINLDQDPRKALDFLEKVQIGYPSGADPKGRIPQAFGLKTMPTSYLIDANGVIQLVHEGFRKSDVDLLRKHIDELVTEAAPVANGAQ